MTKRIITHEPDRSKKLNDALKALRSVYEPDVKNLVYLIYELGGSSEQIGEALGVTREAIVMKYPKKGRKENGKA